MSCHVHGDLVHSSTRRAPRHLSHLAGHRICLFINCFVSELPPPLNHITITMLWDAIGCCGSEALGMPTSDSQGSELKLSLCFCFQLAAGVHWGDSNRDGSGAWISAPSVGSQAPVPIPGFGVAWSSPALAAWACGE